MLKQINIIVVLFLATTIIVVHSNPQKLIPSVETNPFVVGGHDVDIEDYPFVVACYNWGSFSCGGSILNEEYVLKHLFKNLILTSFLFNPLSGLS